MDVAWSGSAGRVDLARAPAFRLGALEVVPALREVSRGSETRRLEPRVMQVLVALAGARGRILSRDELIECCWDGRIVGDNAINRIISQLRRLQADWGDGAFAIETVTKVGYRLKAFDADEAEPASARKPAAIDRRLLIAGGAIAAVGGAALLVRQGSADTKKERGAALVAEARRVAEGGLSQARHSVALLRQATELDPRSADAWGTLARYTQRLQRLEEETRHDRIGVAVRQAARRALALDPNNLDAVTALATERPVYRRWASAEAELRRIAEKHPDLVPIKSHLMHCVANTGRWRDVLVLTSQMVRLAPLVPVYWSWHANALDNLGQLARARAMHDRAARDGDTSWQVGLHRFLFLCFSGAPAEATAMVRGVTAGLGGDAPMTREAGLAAAHALTTDAPGDKEAAVAALLAGRRARTIGSRWTLPFLCALGATDQAFAVAYDYLLGPRHPQTGERGPLPRYAWRETDILFARATAPMRADRRFAQLTALTGLDDYWRQTGTRPQLPPFG